MGIRRSNPQKGACALRTIKGALSEIESAVHETILSKRPNQPALGEP